MRRMTIKTLSLAHLRQMRLVAVLTRHLAAMLTGMTFPTIKLAMFIRIKFVEPLLIVMTGDTERSKFSQLVQCHRQWLVRIVAIYAFFQGEVAAPGARMAFTTSDTGQLAVRQMLRMTGCATGKFLQMRATIGKEFIVLLLMAGGTEFSRLLNGWNQAYILRLMRGMTAKAIGLAHRFFVSRMTIEAGADFRMLAVTIRAVLLAVTTWHGKELLGNRLMAADTDRSKRTAHRQVKFQRLMRIVAILTITDSIVRMVTRWMTDKAGLWNTLPCLWMHHMTIVTGTRRVPLMTGRTLQFVTMAGTRTCQC